MAYDVAEDNWKPQGVKDFFHSAEVTAFFPENFEIGFSFRVINLANLLPRFFLRRSWEKSIDRKIFDGVLNKWVRLGFLNCNKN